MSGLLELQRSFRRALLTGEDRAMAHVVAGDGLPAQDRLDVHRNNIVASLTAVLADAFPVIRRLGDERFFAYAAHEFIRAHPPARPCLAEYGARFADFLAGFPACRDFAYFPDVARLEWLLHQAARAPDLPALAPSALADVAQADTPRLTLMLQPSLGWLESPWPVDRVWQANRDCGERGGAVDLAAGGVRLEVRCAAGDVGFRRLPAAVFAFRTALGAGRNLEGAADAALAQDAQFDLPQALTGLFAEAAVVALGPAAAP